MKLLLIVGSVLGIVAGLLFTNSATAGVIIVGIACWFALLARIAQADEHQKELKEWLAWLGKQGESMIVK